jgi:hypothetical protein
VTWTKNEIPAIEAEIINEDALPFLVFGLFSYDPVLSDKFYGTLIHELLIQLLQQDKACCHSKVHLIVIQVTMINNCNIVDCLR